mmetsp:Transcript_75876/g.214558  ORF Transcript_75876/g.214558 Transcript_75876/m.214558 type:complete len:195 (+) Transcript_75876:106-690(+)
MMLARALGIPTKTLGREHWLQDESVAHCSMCSATFTVLTRRHHCRACGGIFCWRCSGRVLGYTPPTRRNDASYREKLKRVCDACFFGISEARGAAPGTRVTVTNLRKRCMAEAKRGADAAGGPEALAEALRPVSTDSGGTSPPESDEDDEQWSFSTDSEFDRWCARRDEAALHVSSHALQGGLAWLGPAFSRKQ